MSPPITRTRTVVTVTLEVSLPDSWGTEATLGQVYEQAATAAVQLVQRVFGASLRAYPEDREPLIQQIHLVGVPVVRQVIAEEPR